MRDHLATLVEEFRRYDREIAVVRYQGNRRRVTTYGDIARLAGRFAAFLTQQNIGLGDRVLLWAENSAEWIAAFHGCVLRGALVVPLDAYGSVDFAARVAADVKPKLAVGDGLLLARLHVDGAAPAFARMAFEDWPASLPAQEAGALAGLGRETPLQILFTSGTTGDPKGIVHTHGNVLASIGPIEQGAQGYMRYEKYVHPLRFLHTLPLSHVFGQTMGLWIPPVFRAEVHFENRLVAPRLIETIHRERISVLAAVPRVFALLKAHLESTRPQLSDELSRSKGIRAWKRWWRFRGVHRAFGFKFWALISGGGALPAAVEQFWNGLGFVVVQGYGMTETTALITLNHPFHVARGTIGKPLPGREVKIGPDGEVLVRGPMISTATWAGGALRQRDDDWLATGDLAEAQSTGELRFLGRKSEVIVTGTGVNIHPEDLEAVIEEQPGVAACAVVATETPSGPEPCAVLAMRGSIDLAPAAIENANRSLADFQRVRRWMLWPEPDLPRTSTGKVRRKAVAAWVQEKQAANNGRRPGDAVTSSDWLLALIAEITGETPPGESDALRLSEDLHLDSLGRVQLAAAVEQKLGTAPESGLLEEVQTLGQLRHVASRQSSPPADFAAVETPFVPAVPGDEVTPAMVDRLSGAESLADEANARSSDSSRIPVGSQGDHLKQTPRSDRLQATGDSQEAARSYIYPHWPWSGPVRILRAAFIEGVMRPLVWLLAKPHVSVPEDFVYYGTASRCCEPCHHLRWAACAVRSPRCGTSAHCRRHVRGDARRLPSFPQPGARTRYGRFFPFGPIAYFLLTALFNVFPLPRRRDFQRSFAHSGEALDRGYHVLVFPEGTRSGTGTLAPFRPGIGMLVKQSAAAVLPVAIRGLGELKVRGRGWFRSGSIEVHVGQPIRFGPEATESAITARLHAEVEKLLNSREPAGVDQDRRR